MNYSLYVSRQEIWEHQENDEVKIQKSQKMVPFNTLCIVTLGNLLLEDAVDAKSLDYCK